MTAPEQQHQQEHPEIRAVLQATAREFQPDRTAMINRVAASRGKRRAWFLLRPVGSATAVVVISALSVAAVRAADTAPPAPIPAAPSPSAPAPTTSRAATATDQHPTRPAQRFVSAKGAVDQRSVATWSQSNVTISSSNPIESLTLTISVAVTPGLTDAGKWTNAPNADVDITVTRDSQSLHYVCVLRKGRKLPPGDYLFAAQFTHRDGRRVTADSYSLTARSGGSGTVLSGSFS